MQTQLLIADTYLLEKKLGVGGMGTVFQARNVHTSNRVAIKRVHAEMVDKDSQFNARFQQEEHFLRQLNHPNILQILDSVEADGVHYIIMEYVPGGSLADLLSGQRPLPIPRVLNIATQLTSALIAAHDNNIIHCDLKPANVLIANDGSIRLTDFGAAHTTYSPNTPIAGGLLGTVAYMSPEQCNDEPLDTRTDIWSLGVMLYEMLTGALPFDEYDAGHQVLAILADPTPDIQALRPEVNHRLADLIYRMMVKNRYQRIPDMRLVHAELLAMQAASDSSAARALSDYANTETADSPSYYLPYIATPFIGRRQELQTLHQHLHNPNMRLVTIYGLSGIGKTRLALQCATTHLDNFKHGVYFIDLSSVQEASQIVPAIADALQFNFYAAEDLETQLLNFLHNKEMLLLLDNLEMFAGRADFIQKLIHRTRWPQLFVTSLEKLGIPEERPFHLDGLDTPNSANPAAITAGSVQLFMQSARRVRINYDPDDNDLRAIVQISNAVNGMPLGIELAAAWMHVLTPTQIAAQIQQDMDFLVASTLDVPRRQQSMRSVLEHSWRLLDAAEQVALRRLAVFRGSFHRDAAHRVIGASPRTLNALIDKSLLSRSPVSGRYQIQVILRRFLADKLAETLADKTETESRYAEYYLSLVQQHWPHLRGGINQMRALRELEREFGNIRAAWLSAVNHREEAWLEQAVDGMYTFYLLRGRQREGAEVFGTAVRQLRLAANSNQQLVTKLLARQGACSRFVGRLDEARLYLEDSLELAEKVGATAETAFALVHLGAATPGDPQAVAHWERGLALAESLNDDMLVAEALNWLAFGRYQQGKFDTAVAMLERALIIRRQLADRHGLAVALSNLGVVNIHLGRYEEARHLLEEALITQEALNNRHGMANIATNLSHISLNLRNYDAAQRWSEQALAYYREMGDRRGEGLALGNLSEAAFEQGQYDQSRFICRECIGLYQKLKLPIAPYLNILGRIALAQSHFKDAAAAFAEALAEKPDLVLTLNILTGVAAVLQQGGERETAVGLLRFIQTHPAVESAVRERVDAQLQTITTGRLVSPDPHDLAYWLTLVDSWLSNQL